jgi:hypothetical protein
LNSFSFEDKDPIFARLKTGLALRLINKGLFYIFQGYAPSVIKKYSDSHQLVISKSSDGHPEIIRWSSASHQMVISQSSANH